MSNLNKICGIYKIISPSGKIYIGQSVNIKRRFITYKGLEKSIWGQVKLYNSFLKHGVKNHIFEIIEECEFEKLNIRERYWQDFYGVTGDKGLNCILTETNIAPARYSEETRAKMSRAQSKENNPMWGKFGELNHFYGKKHTEEWKKEHKNRLKQYYSKNVSSMLGKKHTEKTKKILSALAKERYKNKTSPNLGKVLSEEIKNKMSETRIKKGIGKRGEGGTAKITLNLETGIFYDCIIDASESCNVKYIYFKSMLNINSKDRNKTQFITC